ncbi:MAG TPA: hypothetical protein VGB83_07220 [Actinomycetota bacterium]
MDISKALELLERAAAEPDRIRRHLMVAAAIGQVLSSEPFVVGGLAEDFYTNDRYTPTDLDLCAPLTAEDGDRFRQLGFERDGRHWYHEPTRVAVEFPDERIDGDESRAETVEFDGCAVKIIGLDDLYLDRLRQATMTESEADIAFVGAVAVAASRFEDLDWRYIRSRIGDIRRAERMIGESMSRLNPRVRRKARKAING